MPELRQLHDLTLQVRPPALDRLAAVAAERRRRSSVVAAGAATCVLLALVLSAALVGDRDSTSGPVDPGPVPSPPPSTASAFPTLTAEEIRNHRAARSTSDGDFPAAVAGVSARIWSVCLDDCTRATEPLAGEQQTALEVSRDDFATGALYVLDPTANVAHVVDDLYVVDEAERSMLVDSRGRQRPLEAGEPVAIGDIAGPLVHTRQGLAAVDVRRGQLRPLERVGDGFWDWQAARDTWMWGAVTLLEDTTVTRHGVIWRRPDGSFHATLLPIGDRPGGPGMLRSRTPGTMAIVEHFADPRLAHISDDYGATWQVRRVPDDVDSGGRLPDDWPTWPRA